jgi:hypothetical protein
MMMKDEAIRLLKILGKALVPVFYVFGHLIFTAGFGLWLIITIRRFDRTPNPCTSSTVYFAFGTHYPVERPTFRHFWLAVYIISATPYNVVFLLLSWAFVIVCASLGLMLAVVLLTPIIFIVIFPLSICIARVSHKASEEESDRRRSVVAAAVCSVMYLISFAVYPLLLVIFTEKTIQINSVAFGEGQWTFGQTIAIIVVLPVLVDVASKCRDTFRVVTGGNVSHP